MRLIDGNALKEAFYQKMKELLKSTDTPQISNEAISLLCGSSLIIEAPTIYAEPVVRCGECKYMTEHYDTDGNAPYWTCSEWDSGTDYDGFCHYGERKNDE